MAKFNLGDKVRLKSDVAKRLDVSPYRILTITNIFDCGHTVYNCYETGCVYWEEYDFEDTKYITSLNGDIIGTVPINDTTDDISVVRGKMSENIKCFYKGDIAKLLNKGDNSTMKMPEINNYTYNNEIGLTTIEWCDGTKTIVRAENPDMADQFTGFMTAYAKKASGNTNRINNLFDEWIVKKPKRDAELKAKEERIIAESKSKEERDRKKREKHLIRREALRIKREYEAKKLANEKYSVPIDNED